MKHEEMAREIAPPCEKCDGRGWRIVPGPHLGAEEVECDACNCTGLAPEIVTQADMIDRIAAALAQVEAETLERVLALPRHEPESTAEDGEPYSWATMEKHDDGSWISVDDVRSLSPNPTPTKSEGWRSIESAPKDGTLVLLTEIHDDGEEGEIDIGCWELIQDGDWEGGETCYLGWSSNYGRINEPTHWMPRPAAPNDGAEGE